MTDLGLNACRLHLQRCSGRMPTTSTGKQNDSNGKGKHGKVSFGKMSAKSGEIEKTECRKPCFGLRPTACFFANNIRTNINIRHSRTKRTADTLLKGRQRQCKRRSLRVRKTAFCRAGNGKKMHTWPQYRCKPLVVCTLRLHTFPCVIRRKTFCFSEYRRMRASRKINV